MMTRGLAISEQYYEEYGRSAIDRVLSRFPQVKIAAGLVGEGSQCLGFDDELSRDHDFAPGFCIWLSEEDFQVAGPALQQACDSLPSCYRGLRRDNVIAANRLGVMTAGGFYRQFTGCAGSAELPGLPQTNLDWFMAPENALASATNGKVFRDDSGTFTAVREKLLAFYPADILRKKIAARCAVLSQAGQYNLLRVIRRGDTTATMLAAARFSEAALSMVHLLNRKYTPFYKWAYRSASSLPLLSGCADRLKDLPEVLHLLAGGQEDTAHQKAFAITEEICTAFAAELRSQGFSAVQSDFLQDHLTDIMSGISDPQIRAMHPMADYAG